LSATGRESKENKTGTSPPLEDYEHETYNLLSENNDAGMASNYIWKKQISGICTA
jgi:hypothetical protein